MTLSYVADG